MTAPGWYPDPYDPSKSRWWDGTAWTGPQLTAVPRPMPAAPSQKDVTTVTDSGIRARKFLLIGAAAQAVAYIGMSFIYGNMFQSFVNDVQNSTYAPCSPSMHETCTHVAGPVISPWWSLASMVFSAIQLVYMVALVLFMVWAYQSASLSRRMGVPARLQPFWAVLGFFVPLVNLWFPYQVVADMLPTGHKDRRLMVRWWVCYIMAAVFTIPMLIASFFSVLVAFAFSLVASALAVLAAVYARQAISAVLAFQTEALVDSSQAPETSS